MIYLLWMNDEWNERKNPNNLKNKEKSLGSYPPIPPSMIWRAGCFPVSYTTKNKERSSLNGKGS